MSYAPMRDDLGGDNDLSKRRSPFGLFESCRDKQIFLCFMKRLSKLMHFGGRMGLRMKLIAKKELILLFQMTPSRILCDQ